VHGSLSSILPVATRLSERFEQVAGEQAILAAIGQSFEVVTEGDPRITVVLICNAFSAITQPQLRG